MKFLEKIKAAQIQTQSMLCVGLDPEPQRFPANWKGRTNHIFDFCAAMVEATADFACAYKPQIAYFAAHAAEAQLEKVIAHIRQAAPHAAIVLDAKRGDIGSTAEQYAKEAFERYGCDAVTLSAFMGLDTLLPYLEYHDKGIFVLCRTSNPGGDDFQARRLADIEGEPTLFEHIARRIHELAQGRATHLGLVVGATYPHDLKRVREIAPHASLLIPGIGVQGGDIAATLQAAAVGDGPLLINASRSILYASTNSDFQAAARQAAQGTVVALRQAQTALR